MVIETRFEARADHHVLGDLLGYCSLHETQKHRLRTYCPVYWSPPACRSVLVLAVGVAVAVGVSVGVAVAVGVSVGVGARCSPAAIE